MAPTLETKVAYILDYIDNRAHNRCTEDGMALRHYIDDPEVAQWLTQMRKAPIWPGLFINGRR